MADGRLEACLAEVLAREGGYVDHPSDPGGATNMGITRQTLARWRAVTPWWALEKAEVKALTRAEAAEIYRALYWQRCRGDDLPAGLDLALFDFAVNSGPDRAIRTLQDFLGVKADGHIGPITLSALAERVTSIGAGGVIEALCELRLGFLGRLDLFAVFGRGWRARVEAIRLAALGAAADPERPAPPSFQSTDIWSLTMNILAGYRTYIVAAFMVLAGVAQLLGVELPALDGRSAGQLIMEAVAVAFLRRAIKTEIGNA